MERDIKISIIVPAYNVEKWLPRCINSILNQTHTNLEIIIINDGSTDNTGIIIDNYAQKDTRIVPIHQNNNGLISVRERGIEIATGKYIGFIDGDDEVESDMFERLLKNAIKYNADISHCGMLYCFYDGRKKAMHGTGELIQFDKNEGLKALLDGVIFEPSLCNKIYVTHILKDSCLNNTIMNNEDLLRNFVLFSRANNSVYEDFCGYHYWRRAESMSNNERVAKNNENIIKVRKIILDHVQHNAWISAYNCYMIAVINGYNSVIDLKDEESVIFYDNCKHILKHNKKNFRFLEKRIKYRTLAIIYFPMIYNFLYRIHNKRRHAKIAKLVRKLENNNYEK